MSIMLRIVLLIVSILTMVYIISRIRKSKMKIETSLFWIFFSLLCVIFAAPEYSRIFFKSNRY